MSNISWFSIQKLLLEKKRQDKTNKENDKTINETFAQKMIKCFVFDKNDKHDKHDAKIITWEMTTKQMKKKTFVKEKID